MIARTAFVSSGLALVFVVGCGDDGTSTSESQGSGTESSSTGSASAMTDGSQSTTNNNTMGSAEGSATGTTVASMNTDGSATGPTTDDTTGTATMGGTTMEETSGTEGTSATTGTGTDGSTGGSTGTDSGGVQPSCPPMGPDATLTGTVLAPNGEIPVSGALVYTTQNMPEGIPQQVYCAECEELECDDIETFTDVDGTFTLNTNASEANYLVVQKGQFMRITPLNVNPGDTALDEAITTLPGENDPANGLYIPLVAVGNGSYDRLEDALGKFGLGDTMIANFEEHLVPGTEPFDLYNNGRDPAVDGFASQGTFGALVQDPAALAQYHIIFVPCSTDAYVDALQDPQVVQNIRDWVEAGGRWYVADWANEWMGQTFPEYQEFQGGNFGGGDLGVYDSLADVLDQGLLDWLDALPNGLKDINPQNDEPHPTLFDLPQLQTVDNWSAIIDTPEVLVDDGMGGQIDVGHKIWLEGPGLGLGVHPLTVTGQYGCGKIQFTSYHTAEFFDYVGLSPQELVLIYTILEIGVCQTPQPTP